MPLYLKKIVTLCYFLVASLCSYCQDWTDEQLSSAATAADINWLTEDEQNAIMYINLARMYPKDFVRIELEDASELDVKNLSYLNSLKRELNSMLPAGAVNFDNTAYEYARCFAKESGQRGIIGHKRKTCPRLSYAECCSYGVRAGWDIALQWLIDEGVPDLGHRKNCLGKNFTKIGLSIQPHKKYAVCAVADFK